MATREVEHAVRTAAAGPFKSGVQVCALKNALNTCSLGVNGVPATSASQAVASVNVVGGTITVTPEVFRGIQADNLYTITPTSNGAAGDPITEWVETCAGATPLC